MDILWVLLLLVVVLAIAAAAAWYWWKHYKKGAQAVTYSTYYSGFWHYGMLSGYPYENQLYSSAGALSPTNNPQNSEYSPKNIPSPKSNMATYKPFLKGALCAGTYDKKWNGNSDGWVGSGDWTNNKAGGKTPSVMVATYSSSTSDAPYFNWGIQDGNLFNEGVGTTMTLVPNMDSSNYPQTMPPDTDWPPYYLALTFMSPPTVDNKNYFSYSWSYGAGLKSSGSLQPATLPDLSYANAIMCTVQMPKSKGSSTLTSVTYWLNASGTFYVNRSANPQCLAGPCMLVCPTLDNNWYSSVNTMSFSLMWQQGAVCDVYDQTLKQLKLGGGACSPYSDTTCSLCYASVPGASGPGQGTCESCNGDKNCESTMNQGYVGYWFEYQAPAPNPNSSPASS